MRKKVLCDFSFFCLFIWPHSVSCVIVSRPGIEPVPSVLEARSLSHWMTGKFLFFFFFCFFLIRQIAYQSWSQRDKNERGNGYKIKIIGSPRTKVDFIDSSGGVSKRQSWRWNGCVPRDPLIYMLPGKYPSSHSAWLSCLNDCFHSNIPSIWLDLPLFGIAVLLDVMNLAEFRFREQFIMKAFYLKLREICLIGMTSPPRFLNSTHFSSWCSSRLSWQTKCQVFTSGRSQRWFKTGACLWFTGPPKRHEAHLADWCLIHGAWTNPFVLYQPPNWSQGGLSNQIHRNQRSHAGASQVVPSQVKNLPAKAGDIRDVGLIPGLGRSPGEVNGNPLQYSFLENPHGPRSVAGYSPLGHRVGHN